MEKYTRNCPACQGSGKIEGLECVTCDGYGYRIEDAQKQYPGKNEENRKNISEITQVEFRNYSGESPLPWYKKAWRKFGYIFITQVLNRIR